MLTEKKPKAERFLHKSVEPALEHYLNIKVNGFSVNKGGTADLDYWSLDSHLED